MTHRRFPRLPRPVRAGAGGLILLLAGWLSAAEPVPVRPDDNRFTPVVLTQGTLDEPMVFEVLADGRVYIAERKGGIKVYDPSVPAVKPVGSLAVNTKGNHEQGLAGMTVHPRFVETGWIYLYYFHPTEAKAVVSRWSVRDDVLVANSEQVMMEWPAQRETCCHTGGGMTWDADGNLLITTGNNRGNNLASHTDERPGRAAWDDQGGTANPYSFEGKILRIHPEDDGSYTIPKGNLFPPGTAKTRPEIYTMGHRNAWRVSIDSQTGYVYWGEVGPDARQDTEIGPKGYDEFNQARGPGFFGWPYFVGESAYPLFDYAADKPGEPLDPARPVNRSPNNTGLQELPPLAPSFIYYPYDASEKFPEVGTGGRSATGGPIYRRADLKDPRRPWPPYYEGRWLAADLSRRWIMAIEIGPDGGYRSMERFLPSYRPVEPIDLKFGPEGDLYVLEYGGRWFQKSPEAKLVRIEYEGGNRKPVAVATADRTGGVPPFEVRLSSAGTEDFDRDPLTFRWEVFEAGRGEPRVYDEPNPVVRLEEPGPVVARLTVSDPSGAADSRSVSVVSGNEPPVVSLRLAGNSMFHLPGAPVEYAVEVSDREDGTLSSGAIPPDRVSVSIDYAAEGFDVAALKALPPGEEAAARFPVAQALIARGNCRACHQLEGKLVGPAFADVARRHAGNPDAFDALAKKIVTGGAGAWGEVAMPPNASITDADAAVILRYILSLAGDGGPSLPVAGRHLPRIPAGDPGRGQVILRAVYSDQGVDGLPPLAGDSIQVLRSPLLAVGQSTDRKAVDVNARGATVRVGGQLAFRDLDLTGVRSVEVSAAAFEGAGHRGGDIELRLDGPDGEVIGRGKVEPAPGRPGRGRGPDPQVVPVGGVEGRHDLYLVFRRADAPSDATLLTLASLRLRGD